MGAARQPPREPPTGPQGSFRNVATEPLWPCGPLFPACGLKSASELPTHAGSRCHCFRHCGDHRRP
eukprot:15462446-Alexandrium_andersonii.AAC.1